MDTALDRMRHLITILAAAFVGVAAVGLVHKRRKPERVEERKELADDAEAVLRTREARAA